MLPIHTLRFFPRLGDRYGLPEKPRPQMPLLAKPSQPLRRPSPRPGRTSAWPFIAIAFGEHYSTPPPSPRAPPALIRRRAFAPNPDDRVGLLAENRRRLARRRHGHLTAGAVPSRPHSPLNAKQVHYQLGRRRTVFFVIVFQQGAARQVLQVRSRGLRPPTAPGLAIFDPTPSATGDNHPHWAGLLAKGRQGLPCSRLASERGPARNSTVDVSRPGHGQCTRPGHTVSPQWACMLHARQNVVSNCPGLPRPLAAPTSDDANPHLAPCTSLHILNYARTVRYVTPRSASHRRRSNWPSPSRPRRLVDNFRPKPSTHPLSALPALSTEGADRPSAPPTAGRDGPSASGAFSCPHLTTCRPGAWAPAGPIPSRRPFHDRRPCLLPLHRLRLTESSPVISVSTRKRKHHKIGTVAPGP